MTPLTQEEKSKIAVEMLNKEPMQTVGHVALLKLGEMAISTNAEKATMSTEATINNERYLLEMTVTYKKV